METQIKELPNSEIEITGEIPTDDFERAFQTALQELNTKANIPGFRAGKVPENVLLDKVGNEAVLERAAEIALQIHYPHILQENRIEAIDRPKITLTKIARKNPLGFKAVTAVLPKITLPDYKKLAGSAMQEKEEINVGEKEVNDAIEYLRKAKKEKKEAGTEENKEIVLPELNDEFAKGLGQSDLASLKNLLRDNIRQDKERKAKEKKRMGAIDAIASSSTMDLPMVLIEAEKNKMLQELKASIENMELKWIDYLGHIKKSEEDLRKDWQEEAKKRVRYGLVLREIARVEKIEPSAEEIASEVTPMISRYPESERPKIDEKRLKDYAYGILRNEKVFQLLERKHE